MLDQNLTGIFRTILNKITEDIVLLIVKILIVTKVNSFL